MGGAQMLVAEDRNHPAQLMKGSGDSLEKPFSGIKLLSLAVGRIIPVLPNAQYAIHCQSIGLQAQGVLDGIKNGEAMFL